MIQQFDPESDNQRNIMFLVGNGFDIAVLDLLQSQAKTDYRSFFYYLKSINFNKENVLFQEMDQLRKEQEGDPVSNWSDFEYQLYDLVVRNGSAKVDVDQLYDDLAEIQKSFSAFLETVVTPSLLNELDARAQANSWAYRTFSRFIADLNEDDYKKLEFPHRVAHFDCFNFNIVNFNYTAMLDSYFFLDKEQFDPEPHKTVDRDFHFMPNPRGHKNSSGAQYPNAETGYSAYIRSQIHHPHGMQQIPRSLLFGIDDTKKSLGDSKEVRRLVKTFWAQTPKRYEKMIEATELFVVFGSSIGKTDQWWWSHILKSLQNEAELIIYKFSSEPLSDDRIEELKKNFVKCNYIAKVMGKEEDSSLVTELMSKISVVSYSDSTSISGFGFSDSPFEPFYLESSELRTVK